jgi:general secretion pathway protein C
MLARLSAFLVWALVAAGAVFWGLRLTVQAPPVPAHAVPVGEATVASADLTRLLGAPPVAAVAQAIAPDVSARFRLIGVMAPKPKDAKTASHANGGLALIGVDGKPPRAYRIGSRLDSEWVLQSVGLRSAALGRAGEPATLKLEVPPLAPASTGTLAVARPEPGVVQMPPPGAMAPPPGFADPAMRPPPTTD